MNQTTDNSQLAQATSSAGSGRTAVQVPLSDLEKSSARKARKEAEKQRKQAKRYEEQLKKIRGPKSQKIQIIDESFLEKYNNAQSLPSGPSLKTKKRSKKTPSDVVQINLSDCIRDRLSLSEKAENGTVGETKTIVKPVVPIVVTQPIVLHKGKQREIPKEKKQTKLKKEIISNRKMKHETSNSENGLPNEEVNDDLVLNNGHTSGINEQQGQMFQQNVAVSPFLKAIERCCTNENTLPPIVGSEEYQNGFPALHDTLKSVDKINHSRTFRAYCDHFVTDDLRSQAEILVTKLFQFQTSAYGKNPIKAVSNKRYCVGFNEVLKYLETQKLKLVLIAPDLEPNESIDQLLERIKSICRQAKIPYVFGMKRRKLGFHLMKKVPVSCLGVLSYSGADETVKQLLEIVEQERVNYRNAAG